MEEDTDPPENPSTSAPSTSTVTAGRSDSVRPPSSDFSSERSTWRMLSSHESTSADAAFQSKSPIIGVACPIIANRSPNFLLSNAANSSAPSTNAYGREKFGENLSYSMATNPLEESTASGSRSHNAGHVPCWYYIYKFCVVVSPSQNVPPGRQQTSAR